MVLAKELVDKLKKIEDFDITYESSDKDSGEIYIDYNNIVFVLEHYIYEGKFYLSGGLHTITYKGKEYYSDDPLSLDNCATASALVKNGGFYLKNKSNGERQLQSLSKWIHENKADWNEKCLLVFDEVDKGFDLRYQVGLHNMLTNLPVMHGVKILAVSHTLIPMLLEDKVYAFKYRIMLSPSTYVALETGYSIKINDYNEREEV